MARVVPVRGTGRADLNAVEDVRILLGDCSQQLRQSLLLLQNDVVAGVVVFKFSAKTELLIRVCLKTVIKVIV